MFKATLKCTTLPAAKKSEVEAKSAYTNNLMIQMNPTCAQQ
jgi:hypothetical protein